MKRVIVAAVGPIVLALLAGCGSSGKSTTAASTPATPSTQSSSTPAVSTSTLSAPAVLIATKASKLGTVLATGPKKRTVYLFEGDKGAVSACTGACAQVWPPVTTTGSTKAGGSAVAGNLGTLTRPDGTTQVTYNGHPLYLYAKDMDTSDAYGQGIKSFGADWYMLKPSGSKLDKS
jgi:predicted lipoprotein with Yx(FWY)xxD motif